MENTVNERIKKILSLSNLSETSFAGLLGMTQATVNRQLKGVSQISYELIDAILRQFPDVSAEWLLRGDGEMLKGSVPVSHSDEGFWKHVVSALTATCEDQRKTIERLEELRKESNA